MPVHLLIAIVVAFGVRLPTVSNVDAGDKFLWSLSWACLGVLVVAASGAFFGRWVSNRLHSVGMADSVARRRFRFGRRFVSWLGLAVFVATLTLLDWTRIVDLGFGLRRVPLVEELAVLAPYLLGQGLAWVGLYRAERAIRPDSDDRGMVGDLLRRGRQTVGLILPVIVMVVLGRDFLRDGPDDDPTTGFAIMCGLAVLVFVLSPAFVRLAFPLRPLPPGDLRDRLERLSRRLGFRCTDILVWDTDKTVINAGVTGAIPQFRYVLLTDALIESLETAEIEAVFGHEAGHVAHRHLPYFALFFLGSAGLLTLATSAIDRFVDLDRFLDGLLPTGPAGAVIKTAMVLAILGCYFFLAFGAISRRLERQADLYGTRAVSCGSPTCPPHFDPNLPEAPELPIRGACAEGVRIFAHALSAVALLNGVSIDKASWRHGTIARRIAFLESLAMQPALGRRFDRATAYLMWGLMIGLSAGCVAAAAVLLSTSARS